MNFNLHHYLCQANDNLESSFYTARVTVRELIQMTVVYGDILAHKCLRNMFRLEFEELVGLGTIYATIVVRAFLRRDTTCLGVGLKQFLLQT